MIKNLIIKKGTSFLLIITLLFTGFFIYPNYSNAATTTDIKKCTADIYDLAYYDVWKHEDGTWQKGKKPGSSVSQNYTITESVIPQNAKILSVSGEFNFNYAEKYYDFAVPSGSLNTYSYGVKTGEKKTSEIADILYDVGTVLNTNSGALFSLKEPWQAPNVEGYRFYIPVHFQIQYEIEVVTEIPEQPAPEEITAIVIAPASAKTGETFTVSDGTLVGEETEIDNTVLFREVDNGTREKIAEWQGTGRKGENTGGSIEQSVDTPCTSKYILVSTTIAGTSDNDNKTTRIEDGRAMSGQAILELDSPYGYEGHPFDVYDESNFDVDGESYSAKRAYEEGIAKSSYKVSNGTIKKDGLTSAICTIPQKGFYPINLNVTLKNGERLNDNKIKEIRKTPYVIDNLGGFQKQNRKQVLTFNIATYPDKPIVDYDITIKDLKTNELISLTKEQPQKNGACIKTRTVKEEITNKYWTTLTVEFLTKYPRYSLTGEQSQRFSYKIKVTDSKGDTDEAYKEFDVVPDKPPVPLINMQTGFIREAGTNVAKIEAEDGSTSDGDQLQRTWSIATHNPIDNKMVGGFVNATEVSGYENLAFGTNQKIGWEKDGVGKTTVKLHVKDVWIEPTLEEYIAPSDYLEAETTAKTDIINIAPVVSIEPLETLRANISILVSRNEINAIQNKYNELKASFIEKGIDPNISFVPVSDVVEEPIKIVSWVSHYSASDLDKSTSSFNYIYTLEPVSIKEDDDSKVAIGTKINCYDTIANNSVKWTFSFDESKNVKSMFVNNKEKYLFVNSTYQEESVSKNKVLIFNASTGSLLNEIKELEIEPKSKLFLSNDNNRMYFFSAKGIDKLNLKTGKYTNVLKAEISLPRMINGEVGFILKVQDMTYSLCKFNLNNELIDKKLLPTLNYKNNMNSEGSSSISPVDWSNDGKVLFSRRLYEYSDGSSGGQCWLIDSNTKKQSYYDREVRDDKGWNTFMIKDKFGNCEYYGIGYGTKGRTQYYNSLDLLKFKEGESEIIADWDSGKVGSTKIPNAGFYDIENNKIYTIGLEFYGRAWCYNLETKSFEISSSSLSTVGLTLNTGTANIYNDGFTTHYYDAGWNGKGSWEEVHKYQTKTTRDESAFRGITTEGSFVDGENYIISYKLGNLDLVQKLSDIKNAIYMQVDEQIDKIAEQIKEVGTSLKYMLNICGDKNSKGEIKKEFTLMPNTQYEYSYNANVLSGSAIDVFNIDTTRDIQAGKPIYKEVIYKADLTNGSSSFIINGMVKYNEGGWFNGSKYGAAGFGSGTISKRDSVGGPNISFNMEKDGYIELLLANDCYESYGWGRAYSLDDKMILNEWDRDKEANGLNSYYNTKASSFIIFLKAGEHTLKGSAKNNDVHNVIKAIEIGYLSDKDNTLQKSNVNLVGGIGSTVTNNFTSPKEIAYVEQGSVNLPILNLWDLTNKGLLSMGDCGNGSNNIIENGTAIESYCNHYSGGKPWCKLGIKAPEDKFLWISYNKTAIVLKPGEQFDGNYTAKGDRRQIFVTDFKAVEIPVGTLGVNSYFDISTGSNASVNKNLSLDNVSKVFYNVDVSNVAKFTKCITKNSNQINTISFSTKDSSSLLNMLISDFELKSKNMKLNIVSTEYSNKFCSLNSLDINKWINSSLGSGKAEIIECKPVEKDEEAPLVYKKGELIKYGINYSDYENDPSKANQGYSYWIYAHTPYNDGDHDQAAIIYDEDGNISSICGEKITDSAITIDRALEIAKAKGLQVLNAPIDRFYVDGKYTVYHFEFDDTSRGLIDGGYPLYDKSSNIAELTFYVQGTANAPWITGISTSPSKVKENEHFSINIGIDDIEKDILNLTTEVYKDKKHIFTHRKKNIYPIDNQGRTVEDGYKLKDAYYKYEDGAYIPQYETAERMAKTGKTITAYVLDTDNTTWIKKVIPEYVETIEPYSYPVINTGALPDKAQAGKYEVVCTVRDQTGAGLGTYKFTVILEGKITGEVYHTEKWEENRKKYNLANFKNEINKAILYNDYLKLKEPRTRGTNVFWSGEKFVLQAEVAGSPTKVTCKINGTSYTTNMKSTGRKNEKDETIYQGILWDKSMIDKWGNKQPEELTFTFTATYSGGTVKNHYVKVIVDNMNPYWRIHRAF